MAAALLQDGPGAPCARCGCATYVAGGRKRCTDVWCDGGEG